jgi:endonuclease/exonuclease/phosphatase family metal-dependent hydrolase
VANERTVAFDAASLNIGGHYAPLPEFDRTEAWKHVFGQCADIAICGLQEARVELLDIFKMHDHGHWLGDVTDIGLACPILYDRKRFEVLDAQSTWLSEKQRQGRSFDDPAQRSVTALVLRELETQERVLVGNTQLGYMPQAIRRSMPMMLDFMRRLASRHSVERQILMGDFNMNVAQLWHPRRWRTMQAIRNTFASRYAYKLLLRDGFEDAATIATANGWTRGRGRMWTFNHWTDSPPFPWSNGGEFDLDYMLSKGLQAIMHTRIDIMYGGKPASDHHGIRTQYRITVQS